jgi:hypothetical protein
MAIKSATIVLTDIHPGVRVIKNGQAPPRSVCLGDIASEHYDRAAALGTPITRKDAWRFALRDFANGQYRLAPKRRRQLA